MPRISLTKEEVTVLRMCAQETRDSADIDSPDCAFHRLGGALDSAYFKLKKLEGSEE